ncbi:MAG: DNRLRE domain-containing protein [Planctomycetota bacterium]|nr:DNRLRE domain-containing protein [Planctomycetota bacterium]
MPLGLRALCLLALVCLPAFAAETVKCPATADVWMSSTGKECDANMGKAPKLKLKGYQEYALIDFDVSALKGKKIAKARLCFAYADGRKNAPEARGTDLRWFTVSTVASAWKEGDGTNYTLDYDGAGACFNYASFDKREWAYPGSKSWDVILGNGKTLRQDIDGGDPKDGRFSVPIDVKMVQAMVSGASHGLLLMDGSVFTSTNAFIHSREAGDEKAPYLSVDLDGEAKDAPPAPANVKLEPAPLDASVSAGAAAVSLTVPDRAFSYDVKIDGKPAPRWQIPLAGAPGTTQRFVIEGLKPGAGANLELTVVDAAGNRAEPVKASGQASPAIVVPKLPRAAWHPRGADAPALAGKLKVWVFPELCKLDTQSGEIQLQKRAEAFERRNPVWDADGKTVRLAVTRGEIASVQIALVAPEGSAKGIKVAAEGLEEIKPRLFRTWFVPMEGKYYADYAIPMKDGEALAIPAEDNKIPNQKAAVAVLDLIVPEDAKPGERAATLKVSAEGLGEVALTLKLDVFGTVIPKETNFIPELNCYRGPLGDAGTPEFFDAFRVAHYYRCTIDRVPHHHNGNTDDDWIPHTAADGRITDWSTFDKNLGPLLDGSAFKDNPRAGVPVPVLYLPFNESWPLPIKEHYRPGENVPLSGANWRALHDLYAKPPAEAFSKEYQEAFVSAVRAFVRHFEDKGWTRTLCEGFHNNKLQYGSVPELDADGKPVLDKDGKPKRIPGMTGTAWTLDEPQTWLDWQALLFYGKLFKEGLNEAKTVQFAFRADVSRPMWQGSSCDGYMDVVVASGVQYGMLPLMKDMKARGARHLYDYGACGAQNRSNALSAAWCVKAYIHECDGVLPWQSIGGDEAFDKGDEAGNGNMLVVDGRKRFGINAVGSLRLAAFRNGAQICELLRLLEKKNGWNRTHSGVLVSQLIPLSSQFKQAFEDEAAALKFDDLAPEDFVPLKEGLLKLLAE